MVRNRVVIFQFTDSLMLNVKSHGSIFGVVYGGVDKSSFSIQVELNQKMREPSEEIDFGPAESEGRSQTRPVEISLEGSRIPKYLSLIRLKIRFSCS